MTECPICYTCIDNDAVSSHKYGCVTNCGHHFHSHCLYKWTYCENQDHCPYCRTLLDHTQLDYQYALRKILRMKQRQPANTKIDDLLFKLKTDCIKTLDWFCSNHKVKLPFYSVDKRDGSSSVNESRKTEIPFSNTSSRNKSIKFPHGSRSRR